MDRSQAAAWDPFWERLCMDSLLVCWCWLMLASVVSLRVVAVRWCWVRPAISWSAKTEVILRKSLIFSIVCWKSKNFTQSYKAKTILSCQLWFKSQTRSKYHAIGVEGGELWTGVWLKGCSSSDFLPKEKVYQRWSEFYIHTSVSLETQTQYIVAPENKRNTSIYLSI